MSWIKLDETTFAQEANPDPAQIVTTEGLQEVLNSKLLEVYMYENELLMINERKSALELEIAEINLLLGD